MVGLSWIEKFGRLAGWQKDFVRPAVAIALAALMIGLTVTEAKRCGMHHALAISVEKQTGQAGKRPAGRSKDGEQFREPVSHVIRGPKSLGQVTADALWRRISIDAQAVPNLLGRNARCLLV